jgi:hypothetical protein
VARNLKTVSQFAGSSAFTEPQLRWWIFHSNENGMAAAGAVVRVGPRRVYIDVDGFDAWLRAQNPGLRPIDTRPQA